MKASNEILFQSGYMMAPQNYSVNDGDGIRTVLFFAGCPLRCQWCANPESFTLDAKENFVTKYSVGEILEIIEKQKVFYRHSGGGVTFSGGEATVQIELLDTLSEKLYDDGLNLAIETSAHFEFKVVEEILKRMDLIFVDIKLMDNEKHLLFTGRENMLILENIKKIGRIHTNIVVRIPVIEGVNGSEENIRRTAQFVKEHIKKPKIELSPYHTLGQYKYEKLGIVAPSVSFTTPSQIQLEHLEGIIRDVGVDVVSYV